VSDELPISAQDATEPTPARDTDADLPAALSLGWQSVILRSADVSRKEQARFVQLSRALASRFLEADLLPPDAHSVAHEPDEIALQLQLVDPRLAQSFRLGTKLAALVRSHNLDRTEIDPIRRTLIELQDQLPAHSARPVALALTRLGERAADSADARSREGGAWRSLLTGAVGWQSWLNAEDYSRAVRRVISSERRITIRGNLPLPFFAVACAAGLYVALSSNIAVGLVLFGAAFAAGWTTLAGTRRMVAERAREPLWDDVIDTAIADAIERSVEASGWVPGLPAPRVD
jgi:hypothetical protein